VPVVLDPRVGLEPGSGSRSDEELAANAAPGHHPNYDEGADQASRVRGKYAECALHGPTEAKRHAAGGDGIQRLVSTPAQHCDDMDDVVPRHQPADPRIGTEHLGRQPDPKQRPDTFVTE
jgi:hypothetical protein